MSHIHDDTCTHSKGGRPTKYHADIPRLFEEALARGDSIIEFAAATNVCKDTISEWRNVHPEFSAVFTRSKGKSQAFWEKWLKSNLDNPKINAPLVKLYFANRFGWHEKKQIEQTTTHVLDKQNIADLEEVKKAYEKAE